jgi:hypothetical protein
MGSVFVTQEDKAIRGFAGKRHSIPFYLQFVAGYVVEVVHSEESKNYGGSNTINSIIALPHYTDKVFKSRASAGEEYRYFPLLRGINDIPSKGDPVLLCTINKIQYYLGPLNTAKNSPTFNEDLSYSKELIVKNIKGIGARNVTTRLEKGESPNFNKNRMYNRMSKKRKVALDYGDSINETTGDMLLEGRHGNSIRIGSRSNNPYFFISNQRNAGNSIETLGDGSLISITSLGTLRQHFPQHAVKRGNKYEIVNGFTLASDLTIGTETPPNKTIGNLVTSLPENGGRSTDELIYNYVGNQMLLHSDRIILNSKNENMFLSSNNDIHIGAKRNLTISTKKFIIDSEEIYFGNPTPGGQETKKESMVLGTTLLELLKETLAVIKTSQGICQGAPIPLADDTGAPGGVNAKITQIEQKIDQILSTKYFIEPNVEE